MVKKKDLAKSHTLVRTIIMVLFVKEKKKEKDNMFFLMDLIIKDILKILNIMDLVR